MSKEFDLMTAQRKVFGSGLTPHEKLVSLALLNHWSRARETYPSVERLKLWTGLSRSSVLRSIGTLREAGAIAVSESKGRAHRYDLGPLMHLQPVSVGNQSQGDTGVRETPDQCQGDTGVVSQGHGGGVCVTPEVIQEEIHEVTQEEIHLVAPEPRAPKRKRRWTRVPKSWEPKPEHHDLARELGVKLEAELPQFRDHEYPKPKSDADACFRTWLRNSKKFGPRRASQGPNQREDKGARVKERMAF